VFLVIGRQDNNLPHPWFSTAPLFEAGQSLTTKLGGAETNIAAGDPLHWAAIMGIGLLLLVLTAGATWLGTLGRKPYA
jgi:phosphate transport system permease protein